MPPFAVTNPIFVDADGDGVAGPVLTPVPGTDAPAPAGTLRPVVPALRAFETGRRNDECTYELQLDPGR